MISEQLAGRGIKDPRVLAAMGKVPRECFVPTALRVAAYADSPMPIGCGQTISQPYIVAFMLEKLQLFPGARVLEIGTGSGYQAAVLAEMEADVFSVEIIPELAARSTIALSTAGYGKVRLKCGDGGDGWSEFSPYDAIVVSAAAPSIPGALKHQLKIGGVMIIPLGNPDEVQELWTVRRDGVEEFHEQCDIPVRFVPLTGKSGA